MSASGCRKKPFLGVFLNLWHPWDHLVVKKITKKLPKKVRAAASFETALLRMKGLNIATRPNWHTITKQASYQIRIIYQVQGVKSIRILLDFFQNRKLNFFQNCPVEIYFYIWLETLCINQKWPIRLDNKQVEVAMTSPSWTGWRVDLKSWIKDRRASNDRGTVFKAK